ncbi:MAG: CxxC-x17-CxxC domain-containing protein [Patescibacteria group bacterium]
MDEITFFAKTNFRNQERVFGIKTDDRRRHMYVIGKTGMGKTNLLETMAIQDIQNGKGMVFIDPHGDTAEKLIKAIPSNRINDVIYFNPADQDFPIAFNVMESVDPKQRHLVASGLVGVFKKIWADSWGPRLEYILRNAILALLEYPGSTLLGVTRMLVDKNYLKRIVEKITDPVVRSFWVDEFPKWNERVLQEVISPIQNKVGQFLSSSLIRNIVGQTKSSFDVREVMDNQKILIMNLSKGRIGEDNSALIGAMMITKIQLAAMGRVDIPEEERKDIYLYVDEFQNFATESFANILSEARKYRLNIILANQYILQIDEKVKDAIFGNAGTLITFRVGAGDAEELEKEFDPIFLMNDIVNLPKYNIYLKLMIDGIAGNAFSATTLAPIDVKTTKENEEKVIKVSRERYTTKAEEVEEKIKRWSGMLVEEKAREAVKIAPQRENIIVVHPREKVVASKKEEPVSKNIPKTKVNLPQIITGDNNKVSEEKKLYDTVCDTCGEKIQVPFEPDGQRPTFCKECFKDYQRAMAKAKDQQQDLNHQAIGLTSIAKQSIADRSSSHHIINSSSDNNTKPKEIKKVERKAFVSGEKPLALSQLQYVAPKKFKLTHKKPAVNLEELRQLIKKSKDE